MKKTFTSIREAFDYFIKEILPTLPAEERKLYASEKRDFKYKSISEERIKKALDRYGKVKIKVEIEFLEK